MDAQPPPEERRHRTERRRDQREALEAARLRFEFVSMVSHELRTPLTAVKEAIDLVADGTAGPLNDAQREFMEIGKRNIDRLARMLNQVLDYQKLDLGVAEFVRRPERVDDMVKESVRTFAPAAERQGVRFELDLAPGLPPVACDRDLVLQVLANLMSNAVKILAGQARARVRSGAAPYGIEIAIEDEGPGIPREHWPRLFRTFSRVAPRESRANGSGLGLAISKKIVEGHGGTIAVGDAPGGGARLSFTLPLASGDAS